MDAALLLRLLVAEMQARIAAEIEAEALREWCWTLIHEKETSTAQ